MTTLELRSVSKVYGRGAAEVQALRDVSLTVAPGEMVAVMGKAHLAALEELGLGHQNGPPRRASHPRQPPQPQK